MSQPESPTLGQIVSSLTTAQGWAVACSLATVIAGVGAGAFWVGKLVASDEAARQARDDASARIIAVSDARNAGEEALAWKNKYEAVTSALAAATARATQAEASASNATAWYNACAGQNASIAALESRLLSVDVELGNAERSSRDQPEIAVGLREQQRILNEGLANCGLPKRQ